MDIRQSLQVPPDDAYGNAPMSPSLEQSSR